MDTGKQETHFWAYFVIGVEDECITKMECNNKPVDNQKWTDPALISKEMLRCYAVFQHKEWFHRVDEKTCEADINMIRDAKCHQT